MRIIAGKYRSYVVERVKDITVTRPTSDRARESIFNVLDHGDYPSLEGAKVLDVFAGTGAYGFEALSRGAKEVTFIEKNRKALEVLTFNQAKFKEPTKILSVDALKIGHSSHAYDIIFLDPPYGKGLLAPTLLQLKNGQYLHENTVCVAEASSEENTTDLLQDIDFLEIVSEKVYGAAKILFLKLI